MRAVRWALAVPAVGWLFLAVQCGNGESANGLGPQGGNPFGDATVFNGACTHDGETRACHAVVAQHQGYVDCFNGQQTCSGGEWSPCMGGPGGGTLSTKAFSGTLQVQDWPGGGGSLSLQSLSNAGGADAGPPCSNDPCNPYCQGFNEKPPTPIGPAPGCVISYGDGGGAIVGDGGSGDASTDAGCVTTVSGTVYDPGGNAPLPNIQVYQPTAALITLPTTATCESCTSLLTPYSSLTVTATDGTFTLPVTGTTNVKLVMQTGKWRRQITLAGPLTACQNNPIPIPADGGAAAALTRLPKNTTEGDIPLTAVALGKNEPAECLMLKIMGGDTSAFGAAPTTPTLPTNAGAPRIQLYTGSGNSVTGAPNYSQIYGSQAEINYYDQVIFPCIGGDNPILSSGQQTILSNYGNGGGRIFLNHKSAEYTTSNNVADHGFTPWDTLFTYNPSVTSDPASAGGANGKVPGASATASQFRTWLSARGAYSGGTACIPNNAANTICTPDPRLMPTFPLFDAGTPAFEWVRGATNNDWDASPNGNFNLSYSFDLNDAGVTNTLSADGGGGNGCGRVVVNSMHVDVARAFTLTGGSFPSACNNALPMSPNEFMFEYLLFELGACSVAPLAAPQTATIGPPPQPLTYTNTYTMGACGPGQVGQWNAFSYDVSTPPGTEIKFAVQTSYDGGAGSWTPDGGAPQGVLIADVPLDHPGGGGDAGVDGALPSCTPSGPSPCGNNCAASIGAPVSSACPASCKCPIDVSGPLSNVDAGLSAVNSREPVLQLNVSLIPVQSCLGVLSPGLMTTSNGTGGACVTQDLAGGSCNVNADCQEDWHCSSTDGGAGTCKWNAPLSYIDPNCIDKNGNPGIDLTIGSPCAFKVPDAGTTAWYQPICNRGGGTVPAGTTISLTNVGNGGSGAWNPCTTDPKTTGGSDTCQYTLQNALQPGACTGIDTSQPNVASGGPPFPNGGQCAILETGDRAIYINWNNTTSKQPIAECGTNHATAPGGSTNGTGAGCNNNSTGDKSNGTNCGPTGTNACGAPAGPPAVPSLSNWTVSYSCVPAE